MCIRQINNMQYKFSLYTYRNNHGIPLLAFSVGRLKIYHSHFSHNINLLSATVRDTVTSLSDLYNSINTGGGIAFLGREMQTEIIIHNCTFSNNTASINHEDDLNQLFFRENGRGSAVLIRFAGVQNSSVNISNCLFINNSAEVEGAAVYMSFSDNTSSNHIHMLESHFTGNTAHLGSGGAVSLNSYQSSFNNTIVIEDSSFESNAADSGGAVSLALYSSSENVRVQNNQLFFINCSFQRNAAINEGTAVGLFCLAHVDVIGFPVSFSGW